MSAFFAALSPEALVLLINLLIILLAFKVLHPLLAGKNLQALLWNDLLAMSAALLTTGYLFWGSDTPFTLIFFDLNWFGYTLISYSLLEIPFFVRYLKQHDIHL